MYNHQDLGKSDTSHSILLIFHLVVSNVFLLNFLIAILSSVYEIMIKVGDFDFKANMYSYIEKYQIAMIDNQGYDEFVIHPSPINLSTLTLVPFYFRSSNQRNIEFFPKLMFWSENMVMLAVFFVYLILLIPIVYVKMLYNLVKMTNFIQALWVIPIWIVCGIFYLLAMAIKDCSYFLKICCDSIQVEKKDANIESLKKQERDQKIVVYNEVLSTMKSVYIELKKERSKRKKLIRKKKDDKKNKIEQSMDYDWLNDETKAIANKKDVIKAWRRRYHENQHNSSDDDDKSIEDLQTFDINNISNKKFRKCIGKNLLKKIKNSITQIKEDEIEADDSTTNSQNDNKKIIESDSENEELKEETKITESFLSKFLLSSDSSKEGELNLFHALRALPKRIGEINFSKIELMNLSVVQMSIIAFQNDDKDELFNFYDKKMKKRFLMIKLAAAQNYNDTNDVCGRLAKSVDSLTTMFGVNQSQLANLGKVDNKSESCSEF